MNIRPARVGDVPAIYELIRAFAERKLMIRRSMGELYESIREFLVAVDDEGGVIGCVGLHVFWEDLAELRCLAVAEHRQGHGLGRRLVNACWESARDLEIATVFTLTHATGLFDAAGITRSRNPTPAQDLERMRALPAVSQLPGIRADPLRRSRACAGRCGARPGHR